MSDFDPERFVQHMGEALSTMSDNIFKKEFKMQQFCNTCGHELTLLFISSVCDYCDDPDKFKLIENTPQNNTKTSQYYENVSSDAAISPHMTLNKIYDWDIYLTPPTGGQICVMPGDKLFFDYQITYLGAFDNGVSRLYIMETKDKSQAAYTLTYLQDMFTKGVLRKCGTNVFFDNENLPHCYPPHYSPTALRGATAPVFNMPTSAETIKSTILYQHITKKHTPTTPPESSDFQRGQLYMIEILLNDVVPGLLNDVVPGGVTGNSVSPQMVYDWLISYRDGI